MKSPFPGMDPYLEQHWGKVHLNLIAAAQGLLNERLPGDLRARVEERIVLEFLADVHEYIPDVRAAEHGTTGQGPEPETQGFIEILETRPERRVITVIEVLSPSNKYEGRAESNTAKSSTTCDIAPSASWKSICCARARMCCSCPSNSFHLAIGRPIKFACIAAGRPTLKSIACRYVNVCRRFAFHYAKATPMCRWTCRRWWTKYIAAAGTMTSTTLCRQCRLCKPRMRNGPMSYCVPRGNAHDA